MSTPFTRRAALLCALAAASPALARAPMSAERPLPRGTKPAPELGETIARRAGLSGRVGFVVADTATGEVLDTLAPDVAMPPASTLKAVTSLYALDKLGPDWRFRTSLVATGPVEGGIVQGDLCLVGSGDPTMDTDRLLILARALKARGITGVSGRFTVWDDILPDIERIDAGQPEQVGYNPALGGVNLNFNRVHFSWKRDGDGYDIEMLARGKYANPSASRIAQMSLSDRKTPVYDYHGNVAGRDRWSVAQGALGNEGSRWLPVREPSLYGGSVFRTLAQEEGVRLPTVTLVDEMPQGDRIVSVSGRALKDVLRGMMRYSTNLTAEVAGLTSSRVWGGPVADLAASGARMTSWAKARYGIENARFRDHSGLGYGSEIAPADMVKMLLADPSVRPIMKGVDLALDKSRPAPPGVSVVAKTGTLNFVSTLAGYVATASGRDLTFAILTADTERRDAIPPAERERPAGGKTWARRSRSLQKQLLRNWATALN